MDGPASCSTRSDQQTAQRVDLTWPAMDSAREHAALACESTIADELVGDPDKRAGASTRPTIPPWSLGKACPLVEEATGRTFPLPEPSSLPRPSLPPSTSVALPTSQAESSAKRLPTLLATGGDFESGVHRRLQQAAPTKPVLQRVFTWFLSGILPAKQVRDPVLIHLPRRAPWQGTQLHTSGCGCQVIFLQEA